MRKTAEQPYCLRPPWRSEIYTRDGSCEGNIAAPGWGSIQKSSVLLYTTVEEYSSKAASAGAHFHFVCAQKRTSLKSRLEDPGRFAAVVDRAILMFEWLSFFRLV